MRKGVSSWSNTRFSCDIAGSRAGLKGAGQGNCPDFGGSRLKLILAFLLFIMMTISVARHCGAMDACPAVL